MLVGKTSVKSTTTRCSCVQLMLSQTQFKRLLLCEVFKGTKFANLYIKELTCIYTFVNSNTILRVDTTISAASFWAVIDFFHLACRHWIQLLMESWSTDLYAIEHKWKMLGKRLHLLHHLPPKLSKLWTFHESTLIGMCYQQN